MGEPGKAGAAGAYGLVGGLSPLLQPHREGRFLTGRLDPEILTAEGQPGRSQEGRIGFYSLEPL